MNKKKLKNQKSNYTNYRNCRKTNEKQLAINKIKAENNESKIYLS